MPYKSIFCPVLLCLILLIPRTGEVFSISPNQENWTEQLQLTEEQVQTLKTLQGQYRQELVQIHHKVMLKRMELRSLTSDEFKGEKGDDLRRQIRTLRLQTRERALAYQNEALTILSPEQRKKLPPECALGFYCREWFPRGMGRGFRGGHPSLPSLPESGTIRP